MGQFACGVIAVIGLVVIAMPLAIVGSNFTQVWEERRLGVIALEVKKLLVQAGFSANDVFEAFALFDTDGNGERAGVDSSRRLGLGLAVGGHWESVVGTKLYPS